ncbi:helix-turn-helix domain-containing protein [Termitidicoccus mucosus]|uniref:XRE family transcriptional regulator n=1 Tax=Termitidicoccus mucosus TaxID=1184151 RepID=A0A178IQC7_9BACT|nr:XRE family transcriptional regulator [Opitutaceae bacterium TSB47]
MKKTTQDLALPLHKMSGRRHALGFSQAELARRCGVTRQFVNLVECGRTQPNVQVALRLASELQTSVEELFGEKVEPAAEEIPVNLVAENPSPSARINLAWVSRRWIGHRADTAASLGGGFQEADAVATKTGGAWHARVARGKMLADMQHNVAIAGCDPALALLVDGRIGPGLPGRSFWVNCGSGRALELLAGGAVHVAGLHSGNGRREENLHELRRLDPHRRWRLVRFTQWEQGWMVRPGMERKLGKAESLAAGGLRLANRERGSGSRNWIDGQLRAMGLAGSLVPGYGREFESHWECARALLQGDADVAAGPRAVAEMTGLKFVPDGMVAFDLVIPRALLELPRVAALLDGLRTRRLRGEIESLPGYRADEAGMLV